MPSGVFHGRTPRARPTKFATVMGALSSKSLHSILPMLVSMVARSCLPGGRPLVASSSVNLPCSGSSGETGTVATGSATTLPLGGAAGRSGRRMAVFMGRSGLPASPGEVRLSVGAGSAVGSGALFWQAARAPAEATATARAARAGWEYGLLTAAMSAIGGRPRSSGSAPPRPC